MKKLIKISAGVLAAAAAIASAVYFLLLSYPELDKNPSAGKWYRVSSPEMKDSKGSAYHAFFKKGSENKVMIYFAGGGVSINEETARDETYNTKMVKPDLLANCTMNLGGIASGMKDTEFEDWSIILFPYATGDFHAGAGAFKYTGKDGKEKILYHHGYINYTEAMKKIIKNAGIENAQNVLITGYSAGGFGAVLLADDIFTNYFPESAGKTVLADASLLLHDDWRSIAEHVWQSPSSVSGQLTGNNLLLDCMKALREKYKDGIRLLFDSSVRDGDLAKVQNYFDTGVMDVDEKAADVYQQILKETAGQLKDAGVSLFIWDGIPWYDDPRNLTMHTIIALPAAWVPFENSGQSVGGWVADGVYGTLKDYGLDLLDHQS